MQRCDNKLYGIAAIRRREGRWEDDCRTIHEFVNEDLSAPPRVHRNALPFQSYALAKGFDNCLYAVTKAPSDAPERVYRYDPVTRTGRYTTWQLPPQGQENCWISAATDDHGDLYFLTSDAAQLVKVHPADGQVTLVWNDDPVRQAPYYPVLGFAGAGTHGNFGLDDGTTLYMVYSTDGSLLKVDRNTSKPTPQRMLLDGLPERGGYSDLLLQNDEAGRRRMYLAGPAALYEVDLARRQARRVRKGTYTDLAGCNIFSPIPIQTTTPAAKQPASVVWRGQVLDAATRQPLPGARLRVGTDTAAVPLGSAGDFAYATAAGRTYSYQASLRGYLPADSTWTARLNPKEQSILLRPLTVGATVALEKVEFERGLSALQPAALAALVPLVRLLRDNPGLRIELRGHTDNVGAPEKNVALSQRRVAAVRAYLLNEGIAAARVTGVGFGGSQPVASNAQEVTRRRNRRVEFRITGL
jgi:outer membrane protein OmpA-like peptidoglycan-associated protein